MSDGERHLPMKELATTMTRAIWHETLRRPFTYEATDVGPDQRNSKQLEAEDGGDAEEEVYTGSHVVSQPVSSVSP